MEPQIRRARAKANPLSSRRGFMDQSNWKTMKDVVSYLREVAAGALLELFELHIAMGELTFNAQVLSATAAAIAEEINQLADAPELASRERLRELAKAASKTSEVVDAQAKAFAEIQRGLDAWNIAQPGLRQV